MGSVRLWDFDVTENDKEIVVRAEVPGFEPNELDVRLDNGMLTIKAEKEQKGDRQEEYRSFVRSITLPPDIDTEKAQATCRNGVLELHIPRAEGAQPKRIQVQGQQGATGQPGQQALSGQAGASASQADKQGQQGRNQAGATASASAKK
jgi:Hsp20/alpha crystallin family